MRVDVQVNGERFTRMYNEFAYVEVSEDPEGAAEVVLGSDRQVMVSNAESVFVSFIE